MEEKLILYRSNKKDVKMANRVLISLRQEKKSRDTKIGSCKRKNRKKNKDLKNISEVLEGTDKSNQTESMQLTINKTQKNLY